MEGMIIKQEYKQKVEQEETTIFSPDENIQLIQIGDGTYTYVIENPDDINEDEVIQYDLSEDASNQEHFFIEEYDGNYEEESQFETVYVETGDYQPQEEEIYTISEEIEEEQIPIVEEIVEELPVQSSENYEVIYECSICRKGYKTSAGVKRHINVSHCEKYTEKEDELQFSLCHCCGEPSDSAHTTGDFECEACNKLFILKKSLDRHKCIEHPHPVDNFECYDCKKTFSTKELLIEHIKVHSLQSVKCEGCGKEFSRKFHLARHLEQTECLGQPKQGYECRVCQKSFTRKDNLAAHLKGHAGLTTNRKKKHNTCTFCRKEFSTTALLQIHVRTHTGERPYGCDICDMKFPSCGAMKKHRRTHTGEKPYSCPECDKKFAAKETLNRHWRTHTGDKPHKCQFCGKSFIQAVQLRAHIFHHTGENAYNCRYCNRAFNRKSRLTTHIKFVHEGAERLSCPKEGCSKLFFRQEDIQRHLLSHSGQKPHVCNACGKTFSIKSSLKAHLNVHKKESPVICEVCNRAFLRKDCLMRHMRTKHRDVLEDVMANAEKKRLQSQLLQAIANQSIDKEALKETIVWNELTFTDSIKELLELLVDEDCLEEFGHPETPVDRVLDSVIRRCGYIPATQCDYLTKMRENAKLLFAVVIDDETAKDLLEEHTVDEIILHLLKLARKQVVLNEQEDKLVTEKLEEDVDDPDDIKEL
ncbi:unnamed protein product [Ceutorhynchus assimilis]|uniref:C2H2-type domain-containing protein n=1 Tax=Ceutorhynchus assimilis TaxID=467358 RepID=A0A9N9MNX7_9CUCU|nr:unnamed protein product [Ceutorhynchus assimilis]